MPGKVASYTIHGMGSGFPDTIHTVTFDCWSTLIYEAPVAVEASAKAGPTRGGAERRAAKLAAWLEPGDRDLGDEQARLQLVAAAFGEAWKLHQRAWHRRVSFTGEHMLDHTLQALGLKLAVAERAQLLAELEEEILTRNVCAIEGARELLQHLRARGIRTGLICDTGFTPGRVVRQLLAKHQLLSLLEVSVFSNEIGVTKPHPRAFERALEALGVSAQGAVHVGDLRRSDVMGARSAGMGSVRFRGQHDDHEQANGSSAGVIDCAAAGCMPACARPEADHVVDTYTALHALLRDRLAPARTR